MGSSSRHAGSASGNDAVDRGFCVAISRILILGGSWFAPD